MRPLPSLGSAVGLTGEVRRTFAEFTAQDAEKEF